MIDDRETLDMEGLLRFYAEAGVDMPLSDTPIDRFAEAQRQPVRSAPAQQENKSTATASGSNALTDQPPCAGCIRCSG
jgi:DNA polymerase